jgi:uncharacterized protein (DUF302 family)
MELKPFSYGYAGDLKMGFEDAVIHLKNALAKHGFGVQAEIPISYALKTKIGVDVPREVILGVCNPALAYKAMQVEKDVTVLLPCTLTVRASDGGVHISSADAETLVRMTGNQELKPIAQQAERKLLAALREL